jgi:predicted nucleic acid-binding protein
MRHVFVETNWVFAYAAPAHHKRLDAVELLERARENEIRIHLPAPCLTEARPSIVRKCQPRNEADAIRQFLLRAKAEKKVSPDQDRAAREVLDRFEQQIRGELRQLDDVLKSIGAEPGIELFPLKEHMLDRAIDLAQMDLSLAPFDQAILAAVLGRAEELRGQGETDLCFCVTDADLQPWDKRGNAKPLLTRLYDEAFIWVFGDFGMNAPERPDDWPEVGVG